ncbi:HAD family hydrolase [Paraclostridium ghonii]|uniref:HAD superfamily hydrolase (TIGR01549 family) n=1 Tax=Paraclostridium ghonii TaxID=29358 RepID=A0ABU0N1X6_9FIRM|nr:HAD family hydrolase [Paeniclostridium ghonii]MDQ0557162.1 HAD superfamily hydrolase (TIGR01549 family) [Paeniclostridium ghonii]
MEYTHVVFDIDGTLIDSEKAVLKSLQKTILEEKGIKKSLDDLRFALGIPGKVALLKFEIEDLENVEEKWDKYLMEYFEEITLFDGIRQVVQELKFKGINLGIITSKTKKEYEHEFIRFGIESYFDVIVCADDTLKHKPNSDPMDKYLQVTGAKKEEIIYIGDSIYDIQCSKNAGVDSALALWGTEDSDEFNSTYKLNKPKDILDILNKPRIN